MATQLSCDTIGDLDAGIARQAIDRCIAEAIRDLDDRAQEDHKPRKVNIEITMEKTRDGEIEIDVGCKWSAPAFKTRSTRANLKQIGKQQVGAQFQIHSPDNPDQPDMFEDNEENARAE